MIVVRPIDLSRAFDDLISGARTREEISHWATTLLQADDDELLCFEPEGARAQLWRAILYLVGVDLKDSPFTYLHIIQDFETFRQEIGL